MKIQVDFSERLEDLVLYIAKQSECDPDFGATKMQKILFLADFRHYAQHGQSITGRKYKKWDKGPVLTAYKPIETALIEKKQAVVQSLMRGTRIQKRLIALADPDLDKFTGAEIKTVDGAIASLEGMNASAVSQWSHEFIGWRVAFKNEEIPYETLFVSERPLTPAERARGAELAAQRAR
jgi:uncharacterized phage-associated protein